MKKLRELMKVIGPDMRRGLDAWAKVKHDTSLAVWFSCTTEENQRIFIEDLEQAIALEDFSEFDADANDVAVDDGTVNVGAQIREEQASVSIKRSSDKQEGQAFNENNRDLKAVDENGKEFKPKPDVCKHGTQRQSLCLECVHEQNIKRLTADDIKDILKQHGYAPVLIKGEVDA
jgi:hypothetical protein